MLLVENLNESAMIYNITKHLKGYEIIVENYKGLNKVLEGKATLILSESEEKNIKAKAENFVEEAEEFVKQAKASSNKKIDESRAFAFITLGLYITGVLLAVASPVVGIILIILSIVASIIMLVKSTGAVKDVEKLESYRDRAVKLKSLTDDKKVEKKLDMIIDMIDTATKKIQQPS
jgi:F0F1-type ATP synthase assembly protein I